MIRGIKTKEARRSSFTQCWRQTDACDPHRAWLPRMVPRPQMNSLHGSLSFRFAPILISINSPQILIQIESLKVPTSHPLTKGHSGAQLVQSSTQFVPKEQLKATRGEWKTTF